MSDTASTLVGIDPEVSEIISAQLGEAYRLRTAAKQADTAAKQADTAAQSTISAVAKTLKLDGWSFEQLDDGQLVFRVPFAEVEAAEERVQAAEEKRDKKRVKRLNDKVATEELPVASNPPLQ